MGSKRVGMARVKSLINENINQLKIRLQESIDLVHSDTSNHKLLAGQSGAKLYWEHGGNHDITLPEAKAGMEFTFVLKVGSAHANHIVTQSDDKIYGKVVVNTTNAADKMAMQQVLIGSAVDKVKLHATTTSLCGNAGDVIVLRCLEDGYWTCDARLHITGGNPSSTAVLAD